ncbi:MAG: hypothetical protein Q4A62_06070 [Eikenella sp.]|nr:hypothetical protein [Eikenella sp.]
MGYRIGYQCFASQEAAYDFLLSQQPPVITADGQLIRPVKHGQNWQLNGQQIVLSLPECSPTEQIAHGALVGSSVLMVAAVVLLFRSIYRLIYDMGSDDGR